MKGASMKARIAPAACLALLLASCAAPLRYSLPGDPMAILPQGATAYLRIGRAPLGDFAPVLLASLAPSAQASKYLASMLDKTDSIAVAVFPADQGPGRGPPESLPRFEAVLMGDYPYRSATFALRQDGRWKKDGRGRALVDAEQGLGLSFPGPGIALATSDGGQAAEAAPAPGNVDRGADIEASVEALVDRLLVPGASVIPPRLSALGDSDLVVWVPDPFGSLAVNLFGSEAAADIDIPAIGVLLAADRVVGGAAGTAAGGPTGGEATYELTVVFLMRNEEDARTFRPAVRLAWYGLSRAFLPEEAGAASLRFELAGDAVAASGLRIRASSIVSALASLSRNAHREAEAR